MPIELTAPASGTDKAGRHLPGDPDMCFLILLELLTFGMFFVAYVGYRAMEPAVFDASQRTLDRLLGVINTLLLLTSSWAVVSAVRAARAGRCQIVPRYLAGAIVLGFGFRVIKYFEHSANFAAGISLNTDTFFNFNFALTMIHLGYVVGRTVVLIVLWNNARNGGYHSRNMLGIESRASFWHAVDLLWIFLFPLL